jgi:hypothetical protein
MYVYTLIVAVAVSLAGCAGTPENFSMYPIPVVKGQVLDSRTSVVLVGISGPTAVNYLQFTHSSLPAINVKFSSQADSIVAIPVSVGIRQITLSTITLAGRPGSYVGSMPVGYVPVRGQAIDINKVGIYYLASLDTSKPNESSSIPRTDQLLRLREELGNTLAGLQPINFQWPEK